MWTESSTIWTQVTNFTSYDNNHYIKHTSPIVSVVSSILHRSYKT